MHDHQLLTSKLTAWEVKMIYLGRTELNLAGRNIYMHDRQAEHEKVAARTMNMTDLHQTDRQIVGR